MALVVPGPAARRTAHFNFDGRIDEVADAIEQLQGDEGGWI